MTYEKLPDGSWKFRGVDDPPKGFQAPELKRILDPTVSDAAVTVMLTGPHPN